MSGAKDQTRKLAVVAEVRQGRLEPITFELAACARDLAPALGLEPMVIVIGDNIDPAAEAAARQTGWPTTAVQTPGLADNHGEGLGLLLAELLPDRAIDCLIGGQTTTGLDWAPGLAVWWGAAFIGGVELIEPGPDGPVLGREAVHGKLIDRLTPPPGRLVATIQPGCFKALAEADRPGPVTWMEVDLPPCRTRVIEEIEAPGGDAGLSRAEVIVAAGLGIGGPDNLDLIRRLAGLFAKSAVAGSRPVCDRGWLGYGHQVGLTGNTVAPKLYLACGISGARQHTVGMQGAGFVVAINTDPHAVIFNTADVAVVEDLAEFIPALIDRIEAAKVDQ